MDQPPCPHGLILVAAALSLLVTGFAASASRLVVTPDSAAYIDLAMGIVERGDLSDDRFQFYTPGYPLFLAAVFALFGPSSGVALLLLQHAMVVGCAVLATWLAWLIRPNRWLALTTAICCAASPHLGGYANAVLTEVPYTLLLTACVLTLAWHLRFGGLRCLLVASLLAGLATGVRPIGQLMLPACAGVAFARWRWERATRVTDAEPKLQAIARAEARGSEDMTRAGRIRRWIDRQRTARAEARGSEDATGVGTARSWIAGGETARAEARGSQYSPRSESDARGHARGTGASQSETGASPQFRAFGPACLRASLTARTLAAVAPGAVLLLTVALNNWRTQGVLDLTCNDDMSYYVRAFAVERLPLPDQEAARIIESALKARRPSLHANAAKDYQRPWAVIGACREHLRMSFPQVGRLMREAALPALRSRPGTIAWNTLVCSYRNLMVPDNMYRALPVVPSARHVSSASLPSPDIHRAFVEGRVGAERLRRYLDLRHDPTLTTAVWGSTIEAYHEVFEGGPSRLGLLDSPYEERTLLVLSGLGWCFWIRRRMLAILLAFVVGYHVACSSFFGGVEPRYVIPLQPLLNLLTASGLVGLAGVAAGVVGLGRRRLSESARTAEGALSGLQPQ